MHPETKKKNEIYTPKCTPAELNKMIDFGQKKSKFLDKKESIVR